jgi:hypothetical protein
MTDKDKIKDNPTCAELIFIQSSSLFRKAWNKKHKDIRGFQASTRPCQQDTRIGQYARQVQ